MMKGTKKNPVFLSCVLWLESCNFMMNKICIQKCEMAKAINTGAGILKS